MTLPSISLPKWPAMLVNGKSVTTKQAAEILIKTDSHLPNFSWAGNDADLNDELNAIFGINYEDRKKDPNTFFEKVDILKKKLGVLSLNYLGNNQIVSSYIGGPHGWINWDGDVFCNSYNIGKWPSVEEVFKDWSLIAKTFPYLDLSCTLFDGETSEKNSEPIVRFDVVNGNVKVYATNMVIGDTGIDRNKSVDYFCSSFSTRNIRSRESGISTRKLKKKLKEIYTDIPQYE